MFIDEFIDLRHVHICYFVIFKIKHTLICQFFVAMKRHCIVYVLLFSGTLNIKNLFRPSKMRWSLAAHDICFTCWQHSYLFSLGKCIPVIRGAGVYQTAVDFCIEQLARGGWVHVFPEGEYPPKNHILHFY